MSDTPDFDNMSPEEMMKWMESLAARQGATEGLTTSADMEIQEVDASDERLANAGDYIPYGWSEERWKAQQEKEAAERAARQQQQQQQAPPQPAPEPAAPTASAGGEPDFDNMSPEEMMKWMESLAARQGATEGLTTSADMEIQEVDASDERLANAGDYIPYGWSEERWKAQQEKEAAERAARQQQTPRTPPKAAQQPMFDFGSGDSSDEDDLDAALAGNVLDAPSFDDIFGGNNELPPLDDLDAALAAETSADDDPMSWLSGLADDGPQEAINIDMDAFGDLAALGDNAQDNDDPMGWLAGLAGDDTPQTQAGPRFDFFDEEPTVEEGSTGWLEALGKRQGASEDELVTGGEFELPMMEAVPNDGPGYQPYTFEGEDDDLEPEFDLDDAEFDPSSWLDELASGVAAGTQEGLPMPEPADESGDFDAIQSDIRDKLNSGDVDPNEIAAFFSSAFDKADQRRHIPDYIEDDEEYAEDVDDGEPIQAEIPDWLREQMGIPPIADLANTAPKPTDTGEMMVANLGLEDEAEPAAELPDWLAADIEEDSAADIASIFAAEDAAPTHEPERTALDTSDSWVEAFSMEESSELEEWYNRQVASLDDQAPPQRQPAASGAGLSAANGVLRAAELPTEASLPMGQAQGVPDWMFGTATVSTRESVETEALQDMSWLQDTEGTMDSTDEMPAWLLQGIEDEAAAFPALADEDDIPDWLRGVGDDVTADEVPDWLRDTIEDEAEPALDLSALTAEADLPAPQMPDMTQLPAPVQQSPAPVPMPAANIDVAATLQAARQQIGSGALDDGLQKYELVVRANASLDAVVKDLHKLAESKEHKRNPAVLRVLGDGLMRQGKLQEALDTYRKALNSL